MKTALLWMVLLGSSMVLLSGCTQSLTLQGASVVVGETADGNTSAAMGPEIDEESAPLTEDSTSKTHTVEMIDSGFSVLSITIKAGDTVIWKNEREKTGKLERAMIIGTRNCQQVRSDFFASGESFRWTFTEAGTCEVVDGIYTTESMKVVVQG